MIALYDGSGEPVFPEVLPALSFDADEHCVVSYDRWQHLVWEGGEVDLILHIAGPFDALPEHYLDHLKSRLRAGGFVAVHGPDAATVAEAVVAITPGAEVTQ
jgi:hypothetical protein